MLKLLCKNNRYEEFGSHTGFVRRFFIHKHLEVGKCYNFIVKENGWYYMTDSIVGTNAFSPQPKAVSDRNNLNYFFCSVQEMRDLKFNKIKLK